MFRAVPCSSSGGQIILLQPLVSSLSDDRTPKQQENDLKGVRLVVLCFPNFSKVGKLNLRK